MLFKSGSWVLVLVCFLLFIVGWRLSYQVIIALLWFLYGFCHLNLGIGVGGDLALLPSWPAWLIGLK